MVSLDRFEGCLVGGLMGDCLGAPFEADETVPRTVLEKFITGLEKEESLKRQPFKAYTDDTAMTFALCRSLVGCNAVLVQDIARSFSEEFYAQPKRGYGSGVVTVFVKLYEGQLYASTDEKDVLEPAKMQFGGQGSFGNGAAMRAAPMALYHANDSLSTLINSTRAQSLITHSHGEAIIGAVLQAAAVREALNNQGSIEMKPFLETLKNVVKQIEGVEESQISSFVKKLDRVEKFVQKKTVDHEELREVLGNDITALHSVPAAIYSFLRALVPTEEFETNSAVVRTIFTAIRLGGDTDTIASMAGSIAGVYHGRKDIPQQLARHCEGLQQAEEFGTKLYQRLQKA